MNINFPDGRYVFIWGGLLKKAGGMTRAMLRRANHLLEYGLDVKILLCARGKEQIDAIKYWKRHGFRQLTESNFLTLESYLENKLCNYAVKINHHYFNINEYDSIETHNNENIYYKNGSKKLKLQTVHTRLKNFFYYSSEQQIERQFVVWDNIVSRIIEFYNTKKVTKFIASNGFIIMSIEEIFSNNSWNIKNILIFSQFNKNIIHFNSLNELHRFFISSYCNDILYDDDKIFLFHDPILDFNPGFEILNKKNIYRIAINHGSGFGESREWFCKINPRLDEMIESKITPDIDILGLLTIEAMHDFKKRFGDRSIFFWLPNEVIKCNNIIPIDERDNKVVVIARLSKEKQIDHVLKAWKYIENKNSEAYLHIYGEGDQKNYLIKLKEELKLKKCFFEGYTDNPINEFQKAILSITTSDFEGFSLSLYESLSSGTPVISYNFKYGPQDIINNKNGFLVEKNNIKFLADKILYYLNLNNFEKKSMSEACIHSTIQYNTENYLNRLSQMLFNIIKNKENYTTITQCEYDIININNNTEYTVKITYNAIIPRIAKDEYKIGIRRYINKSDFTIEYLDPIQQSDNFFVVNFILRNNYKHSLFLIWNNSYWEQDL